MDIRHIQKYEYIPVNVSKNNLEYGQKYEYIKWWNYPKGAVHKQHGGSSK